MGKLHITVSLGRDFQRLVGRQHPVADGFMAERNAFRRW